MKKLISVFALFLLFLCMTACNSINRNHLNLGNTIEFSSSEEMLNHLAGIWAMDTDTDEKRYYIFQNDQVYIMTSTMYCTQVKETLDNAMQNGGLDALYVQDFKNVSNRMHLNDNFIAPDPVTLLPKDGEIKLYDGTYDEESIVITEESVFLVNNDSKNSTVMTKISDAADFSTDHFEQLFNQVRDNYQIPASYFLMDTAEYGEMIKSTISSFDWWNLTWSDDDVQLYTPNEALTPIKDSKLQISKKSLAYVYKTSVPTGFIGNDHEESFVITYQPEKGTLEVIAANMSSSDVYWLIAYGLYAVQNVPGAYTDSVALYNDMVANGLEDLSGYAETTSITVNGITYELYMTKDDFTLRQFTIKADGNISIFADNAQSSDSTEESETENTIDAQSSENTEESETENTIDAQSSDNTEETTTSSPVTPLKELDFSKGWKVGFTTADFSGFFHYAFLEDGTCYLLLSDGYTAYASGQGVYEFDGDSFDFSVVSEGTTYQYSYAFDPQIRELTQTSGTAILPALGAGSTHILEEDENNDAESIKTSVQSFNPDAWYMHG